MTFLLDDAIDAMLSDWWDDADYASSPEQLRQNKQSGRMAQDRLGRALANRGFRSRQEIWLGSGRGRLDISARNAAGRNFLYESKHIDLSRYRTPQGQLDVSRLNAQFNKHMRQVQRYQASPKIVRLNQLRRRQNLPPARVRLVYQVPQTTPRSDAIAFQRLMLNALSPHGIAGTVIMPGSRASCAFDA
jgi:hypothetical protein